MALDTYTKELGLFNPYDFDDGVVKPDPESFYMVRESRTFHVQNRKEQVIREYVCTHCGGMEFNAGTAQYKTFLRCVKCEWETCVHSG